MNTDKWVAASLILILAYVPSVMAADVMMGPLDVPLMKYGYVLLMAAWGSLAALLQKIAKGMVSTHWKLIALTDMVNGILAAVLVFMACESFKISAPIEAICFTLGAYGGSRAMESMYAKFISTADSLIDKTTGITTPQTELPKTPE